ncbi:HU family DNA-binding protein [Acidithiobacillus ferridurans]
MLHGLALFFLQEKRARLGRNPRNGEPFDIAAHLWD